MSAPALSPHTITALVLAGLSLLGTVYIEWTHTDQDNLRAIATLQAQQTDTTLHLQRIEAEVSTVDAKVDRLIDGLLLRH